MRLNFAQAPLGTCDKDKDGQQEGIDEDGDDEALLFAIEELSEKTIIVFIKDMSSLIEPILVCKNETRHF